MSWGGVGYVWGRGGYVHGWVAQVPTPPPDLGPGILPPATSADLVAATKTSTVGMRAVHILLECFLVLFFFGFS